MPVQQQYQSDQESLLAVVLLNVIHFITKTVAFARATFRVLLAINLSFLSAKWRLSTAFYSPQGRRVKLLKRT